MESGMDKEADGCQYGLWSADIDDCMGRGGERLTLSGNGC